MARGSTKIDASAWPAQANARLTGCACQALWLRARPSSREIGVFLSEEAGSGIKYMSAEIIGLHDWFKTAPGQYLLDWEQTQFDRSVVDVFGYHALQLGLPELNALRSNRMPHRWQASDASRREGGERASLVTDFAALPYPEASLDLVALPHTLELSENPHDTLREVERVLVPEGRVVISGFNPASLWGMNQRRVHVYQRLGFGELFLPEAGEFIGYWRLRDWLRLLGFEVESGRFGCYRPAVRSEQWLKRLAWMDKAGDRWWPIFGAVYFLVAVKRVHAMRLLSPAWKQRKALASAPVPIANKSARDNLARRALYTVEQIQDDARVAARHEPCDTMAQ
jgi:SAM-dependent methyltransferase